MEQIHNEILYVPKTLWKLNSEIVALYGKFTNVRWEPFIQI